MIKKASIVKGHYNSSGKIEVMAKAPNSIWAKKHIDGKAMYCRVNTRMVYGHKSRSRKAIVRCSPHKSFYMQEAIDNHRAAKFLEQKATEI